MCPQDIKCAFSPSVKPCSCEVITIGSELLYGHIQDTNSTFLAQELGKIGVAVRFRTAVGDRLDEMKEVIRSALSRSDLVITTGGLGPTLDDLTREAVAEVSGVDLEFKKDLMAQIEAMFRMAGYRMPENNRRQAYIPGGGQPIPNPVGTAPGFIKEVDSKPILCLPGVPRELHYLFPKAVIPWLRERFCLGGQQGVSRILKTVGIGESKVDTLLSDLIRPGENPEIGILASMGEIKICINAKGADEKEAQAIIMPLEEEIRARLGKSIFGSDGESLEGVVEGLLEIHGVTLSLVETFTAGLAGHRLHRLPSLWLNRSTVLPQRSSLTQFAGLPAGTILSTDIELAQAIAQSQHESAQDGIGMAIVGFCRKEAKGFSVQGNVAVHGSGIGGEYSWTMAGDLITLQERGAVIGLNTLRLALLK